MKRSLLHRVLGVVALATFVLSFVSPLDAMLDLRPGDDAACGQVQWFSGHPDMRVGTATTAPEPEHCPYCHFLRAVSGASPMPIVAFAKPVNPIPVSVVTPRRAGATIADERPSRAPPSIAL